MRRRRKAKHICQWRGPLRITKKLSNTTFELANHFDTSKTYRRHLSNVRCWLGPVPDADSDASDDRLLVSDIEAGEYAFVRDSAEPDDVLMHMVKFTTVSDKDIEVACYGRTSSSHVTAIYRPVMVLRSVNKPTTRPKSASDPWTWAIPTEGMEDMILLRQLSLLPSGKFTAESRRRVEKLKTLPTTTKRLKFRRYPS